MRDELVDADLAVHVPVDDPRHLSAALHAAEGRALPHAAGDKLKRPRADLLPRSRHADDGADTPAAVTALERLAHGLHVADALEAEVRAAVGERNQMRDE